MRGGRNIEGSYGEFKDEEKMGVRWNSRCLLFVAWIVDKWKKEREL